MDIIKTALNKKGQFASLEWERPCKTLKSCAVNITKKTVARNVRIGAGYDNLSATRAGRENGTLPAQNAGLNGMVWNVYPVILTSEKTGKDYIRIETAKNTNFSTVYFMNGEEVRKDSIAQYLQASEKREGDIPSVMNIATEYISSIK